MSILKNFLITVAACVFFSQLPSYAQEAEPAAQDIPVEEASSEEITVEESSSETAKVEDYQAKLTSTWRDVVHSLDDRRINDALQKIEKLNVLKMKSGRDSLRAQSKHLLSVANQLKSQGVDREAAQLAEAAVKLSPLLLGIYFDAATLSDKVKLSDVMVNAREMLGYDPASVVNLVLSAIYPFLWANVIGLLLFFLFYFVLHPQQVLNGFANIIPGREPALVSCAAAFLVLITPMIFGPLWTLAVWALVFLFTAKSRKWVSFVAGAIIMLWGALIPMRENIYMWVEDPRMKSTVEVLSGSSSESDFSNMQSVLAQRPKDGVLYYAVGQYLRRVGKLDDAAKAFNRSEIILGNQPYTRAQRGLIELAKGEHESAERFFGEAEAMGLSTAAFYYNTSKAKIMLLNTEGSTAYYVKAKKANPLVTDVIDNREEATGVDEVQALAEINLPFTIIIRSTLTPFPNAGKIHDSVANLIMPKTTPTTMLSIGLLLLVLSLAFFKPTRFRLKYGFSEPAKISNLKPALAFIPGFGELIKGLSGRAFVTFSVLVLAFFPYFGWPKEFLALFGGLKPPLFGTYGITLIVLILIGSFVSRRRLS